MKDINQTSFYVKIISIIFSFSIIFMIFIGVLILHSKSEMTKSSDSHFNSHIIADEMYQSSQDLTRFVRMYAATGDIYYKDIYFDVLDIRNGELERPYNYSSLYWDLKIPNRERVTEDGIKRSLDERMIRNNFV